MTISRGQMKRQLYEGGGIMSLSKEGIGGGDYRGIDMGSRTGFGILKKITRGAKKTVKKAVKGVRDIASSDLGKAALLYGTTAGLGALGAGKGFGSLLQLGTYAPGTVLGNLGTAATRFMGGKLAPNLVDEVALTGKQNLLQKTLSAVTGGGTGGNIAKLATLGAVSTFLTKTLGMSEEQAQEELARDPSTYLEQYYRNLNPNASNEEVANFVAANTSEYAVGGRVGFAEGTYKDFEEFMKKRSEAMSERQKEELRKQFEMYMRSKDPTVEAAEGGRIGFAEGPVLPPDTTQPVNPFGPKPGDFGIDEDIPIKRMASSMEMDKILEALFEKYLDMGLSPEDARKRAIDDIEKMGKRRMEPTIRGVAALGGKMDTASDNAMQAAGVEGLPIRKNPKGVKELDLRKTGGFIPPVGIKEKADDIPAMLSNNEFVFTADAVRGAGGGNVELGAQRMYDTMKRLEAGGKV